VGENIDGHVTAPAVICAGLSVRWLAERLAALGFGVHALDCFGDRDTRAVAASWAAIGTPRAGIDLAHATALAPVLPRGLPLCFSAGFEGVPAALAVLARDRVLIGNSPALLGRLASPSEWREVLRACGMQGPVILLPEEARGTEARTVTWLVKRAGSSGGGHIRRLRPGVSLARDDYLQRFEPGPSFGVVFHANGAAARIIGLVRHLRLQRRLSGAFAQGAAIALPAIGPSLRERLERELGRLVGHLGLKGVNGADFILRRDGVAAWLELNARLPGSLPLVDPCGRWLGAHLGLAPLPAERALEANVERPAAGETAVWRAHSVVYAPCDLAIPPDLTWPEWSHDLPAAGSRFEAGEPWLSIAAAAPSAREALLTLRRRMNILAALPICRDGRDRAATPRKPSQEDLSP